MPLEILLIRRGDSAGDYAGAAVGSLLGPVGTVVGRVIGAILGRVALDVLFIDSLSQEKKKVEREEEKNPRTSIGGSQSSSCQIHCKLRTSYI